MEYVPCVAVSTFCVVSFAVSAGVAIDEMSTDPLVSKTSVLPAIKGNRYCIDRNSVGYFN